MPTKSPASRAKPQQTTLAPSKGSKKNATALGSSNGNAGAKKAEQVEQGLFIEGRAPAPRIPVDGGTGRDEVGWDEELDTAVEEDGDRFNESGGSVKRRRVEPAAAQVIEALEGACTPPPPDFAEQPVQEALGMEKDEAIAVVGKSSTRVGPFVEDSDSDEDAPAPSGGLSRVGSPPEDDRPYQEDVVTTIIPTKDEDAQDSAPGSVSKAPALKREGTSCTNGDGFEDLEDYGEFEDEDFLEGEEFDERRWMKEQRRLEMAEGGFEGDMDEFGEGDADESPRTQQEHTVDETAPVSSTSVACCPICDAGLGGLSEQEAAVHVNGCLDGNPVPLPDPISSGSAPPEKISNSKRFQRAVRPAKPGQENPFVLGQSSAGPSSAFSKLMSGHAEDIAWASAAAAEHASRGKPAYQRTCPFYKILPGFFICVDAFRYGAVKGCQAYFLSHFHSDHYIGLTSSWCHGPIYCSRVTANLVRQQLRVDPKWVVDLEFEKTVEVPGTRGVQVTMIPANHCPGSSLYLFEKVIGQGQNPKKQRVLHCGDFRACRAHIEHPLLRPEVMDALTRKNVQQKIDICYLDTTYLNPKYAFPSQEEVIKACADMCVSLNKVRTDETDGWEQMKRERAGEGMVKFVQKGSEIKQEEDADADAPSSTITLPPSTSPNKPRGRLLVVVGTYSIGKERICLGIARALNSKIYAPPAKLRICACLEDPELNARLTSNPHEAQVHMTPLFEIRAETLDDYLKDYRETFSRAVGFRPSGWNYRPPNSRFVESPAVQTVLHSANWKSSYSMRDLQPQRGSTGRASCFGVPYSEHSSFRELTMFCCALRIEKVIPTVNVGSAKSRERMKGWCDKWTVERRKNGLFRAEEGW
ncbi:DNA cross-link repair protein PSO2/SNM1 [Coniosporium tulheliwenetii]|uniref:DNA cross-link repair protein PSO2/SNM1 n=1 Tax=Coniosporium tulheliwenetii TaxID=3383036 RepID=A0ACC2ZFL7_9PEZI|nr:DNA cross-link repair protein PSO2/SNM1 [Cladosporium sp. JES 115]